MPDDTIASRAEKLAALPLFEGLSKTALRDVARLLMPFEAGSGRLLTRVRTAGMGLFIIDEGTVVADLRGKQAEIGPGEFFGELALLDERAVRTVSVRAKTDVTGYVLARDDFDKILRDQPKVALSMLRALARRFADRLS